MSDLVKCLEVEKQFASTGQSTVSWFKCAIYSAVVFTSQVTGMACLLLLSLQRSAPESCPLIDTPVFALSPESGPSYVASAIPTTPSQKGFTTDGLELVGSVGSSRGSRSRSPATTVSYEDHNPPTVAYEDHIPPGRGRSARF